MKAARFLTAVFMMAAFVACDDGVQRSYWDDGTLKSELRYIDGKLNGECVWYFSNGQKVMQADYKDDLKDGHSLRWRVNGQLEEDCWYKHGELDSLYRSYSEKGKLAAEEYYVDGKRNGPAKNGTTTGRCSKTGSMSTA